LNKGFTGPDPNTNTITPFGRAFYERKANYFVFPYFFFLLINVVVAASSAIWWSLAPVTGAQMLRLLHEKVHRYHLFAGHWYQFGILYGFIASFFIAILTVQGVMCLIWVIISKWIIIGRREPGSYDWDKNSYCQRWQLHLTVSRSLYKGYGPGGVLASITGTAYIAWFYRALGANIGANCNIYAGGKAGLMTEPDLVELGDNVSLDACSVVAHLNSRGKFTLNKLKIGNGWVTLSISFIHRASNPFATGVRCGVVQDYFQVLQWKTEVCFRNIHSFPLAR
jgi:hypothetical protein